MVALAISGALCTTLTDLLIAHAGIHLVELELRKASHRAAIRLAGIPSAHPLRTKVDHEAQRQHKTISHPCTIRKLFLNFGIEPRRFAITPNSATLPPAARLLNPYVAPGGKEEAIKDKDKCNATVKVYTDGSMVGGNVGAAAVLTWADREIVVSEKYVGSDREHEVYEAEVIGLLLGLELLARERGVESATFFIDNQAVVRSLQAGKTRNLGYLYEQLDTAVKKVRDHNAGIRLETRWIPGHVGVTGNERVDEAVKNAANRRSSTNNLLPSRLEGDIPINPTAAKRTRREGMADEWKQWVKDEGSEARTRRFIKNIDDTYPSTLFPTKSANLTQYKYATLTQLRTGHFPTASYLHRFTLIDSPRCPSCDAEAETVTHLLIGCRATQELRREREQAMGAAS